MARINLVDLQPQDAEVTAKELTTVKGGLSKTLPGYTFPSSSTEVTQLGRTEAGR